MANESTVTNEHFAALRQLEPRDQWCVNYLYTRLNVIDMKTSSLMRSSSMIIGFLGAIVTQLLRNDIGIDADVRQTLLLGTFVAIVALAFAEILSFRIFKVELYNLAPETSQVTPPAIPPSLEAYRQHFDTLTNHRLGLLWWARFFTALGTTVFIVLFAGLALHEMGLF
jgi:hypothetical protein